jgi:hypothetical protein
MEASMTNVAKDQARSSKSLARCRFRPNQEKALAHPAARQDDKALHIVAPLDVMRFDAAEQTFGFGASLVCDLTLGG